MRFRAGFALSEQRPVSSLRMVWLLTGAVTLGVAVNGFAAGLPASPANPAVPDPAKTFEDLQDVGVDLSQVYALRDFRLTRDRVTFFLNRGFVGLLRTVQGEVTGAVFTGQGEVLLVPPNAVEKQSLARFTQSPVLEEQFTFAYLRFTDGTAQELLARARRPDSDDPEQPGDFFRQWNDAAAKSSVTYTAQSLRILSDWLGPRDHSYFLAQVKGETLGAFEIDVDEHLPEAVRVTAIASKGPQVFADVWCSFPSRAQQRRKTRPPANVVSYRIDTRINPDNSLTGKAVLRLQSASSVGRMVVFELSRYLKVSSVKDDSGAQMMVFQGPASEGHGVSLRRDSWVAVVLPAPHPASDLYTLTFTYEGDVIADVGNGVLYVGEHDSWYPNLGAGLRASYDLSFEYPDRFSLVATGKKVEESLADGVAHSRWVSADPLPVAGFNLGRYDKREQRLDGIQIDVYATPEAEAGLEKRYAEAQAAGEAQDAATAPSVPSPVAPLSPAALLDRVAANAVGAVQYFETLFGPFPYSRLAISQIPGSFGQGWPGLVYLPTLAFLPSSERSELGLGRSAGELQAQVSMAHEIAHQWWGNMVGWKAYHDQWLSEGFASYAAALDLAQGPGGEKKFRNLLAGYRSNLLSKSKDGTTVDSEGPIWLGQRLSNSLDPNGYDTIVYQKSCWVLHMLRMMLRDPSTGSDARFFRMLRDFAAEFRGRDPSTDDFLRHAQKYMTPVDDLDHNHRLDWFFNEWVYGTGIPTYRLRTSMKRLAGGHTLVEGRIEQSDAPPGFEMLVPVEAHYRGRGDRDSMLGLVAVGDTGGRFRFIASGEPSKITIDDNDVLAVVH